MCFHHQCGIIGVFGISLEHFRLRLCLRSPGNSIGAIHFPGDDFDALSEFFLQRVQIMKVLLLVARFTNGLGEF